MALGDFLAIYLPYCIELQEDGSWVVLNREYKPVGFNTKKNIKYSEFPVATKFKGLGPKKLAKLSYTGKVEGTRVYLYNDGTNPLHGAPEMEQYLSKLELLAKLRVAS